MTYEVIPNRSIQQPFHHLHTGINKLIYSDGLVVSFQKTAVAVIASVVVFLKTAVAVITYNFNATINWRKLKLI